MPILELASEIRDGICPDWLLRQGIEEGAAVAFCEHAVVEDDDAAAVTGGADEASAALAEAEHGLRQAVGGEGIFALAFQKIVARAFDGHGWWCERQLGNDDGAQAGAFDVDAFPEAVGTEEHGFAAVLQRFEKTGAAAILAILC